MVFIIKQNNASTSASSRNENLFPRVATCVAAKSDGVVAAESRNSPPVAQSSPLNPEVQYQVDLNERTQAFGATAVQTPRKGNNLSEEDEGSDQVISSQNLLIMHVW